MGAMVVFTGHMLDRPGRVQPRFPAALERQVAKSIAAELAKIDPCCGFACAACGGDILFLEAMIHLGKPIHVVLPCNRDEFVAACIAITGDNCANRRWEERFNAVVAYADKSEGTEQN